MTTTRYEAGARAEGEEPRWRDGPKSEEYRPLRRWETCPDDYVFFGQRQTLFHFSYVHPWLWRYRVVAQMRCFFKGHEGSTIWETDKFVSDPKTRRNCLYCGKEQVRRAGSPS